MKVGEVVKRTGASRKALRAAVRYRRGPCRAWRADSSGCGVDARFWSVVVRAMGRRGPSQIPAESVVTLKQ